MATQDLAFQRKKYSHLSDDEWRIFLLQEEGKARMQSKLPEITTIADWHYPPRLNLEQCSSQLTACYKRDLIAPLHADSLTDLTGGFGIDFFYMSQAVNKSHYIERNPELCQIAEHNFPLGKLKNYSICCTNSDDYLLSLPARRGGVFFLDPARRNHSGGKVFRLTDCEPNLLSLLPLLRQQADYLLFKLSPMLDTTAAIRDLGGTWQTHIVALAGEVKEVLLFQSVQDNLSTQDNTIYVADVESGLRFSFTREEEAAAQIPPLPLHFDYLYEPHPALLKAGAFRTLAERYHLSPLSANTHLYASSALIADFPGRTFHIHQAGCSSRDLEGIQANVLCRNFTQSADELRKRLRIKDGGNQFIIGAKIDTIHKNHLVSRPTLFITTRI